MGDGMLVVTGALGFIGANLTRALGARGAGPLAVVDTAEAWAKRPYLRDLDAAGGLTFVERDAFPDALRAGRVEARAILHLGACSDTTVTDAAYVKRVNTDYTRALWAYCAEAGIPLIYASSAATYGDGAQGFDDRADPSRFQPLNLYARSKQDFDLWALDQDRQPPRWAGLKYFNVYGPREEHKGRMASMAYHGFRQIRDTGRVKLFAGHEPGIEDGGHRRDFIYVEDAVAATLHFLDTPASDAAPNGLYNVGTGRAQSFNELIGGVFAALEREPAIDYVPMPEDLRGKYQSYTQATTEKLRAAGYAGPLRDVSAGASAYVHDYLVPVLG